MNYIDLTIKEKMSSEFREKAESIGAKIISVRQCVLDTIDLYIEARER